MTPLVIDFDRIDPDIIREIIRCRNDLDLPITGVEKISANKYEVRFGKTNAHMWGSLDYDPVPGVFKLYNSEGEVTMNVDAPLKNIPNLKKFIDSHCPHLSMFCSYEPELVNRKIPITLLIEQSSNYQDWVIDGLYRQDETVLFVLKLAHICKLFYLGENLGYERLDEEIKITTKFARAFKEDEVSFVSETKDIGVIIDTVASIGSAFDAASMRKRFHNSLMTWTRFGGVNHSFMIFGNVICIGRNLISYRKSKDLMFFALFENH